MESIGTLASIWRYPVKSLAAEPLAVARIEAGGIPGDRAAALVVDEGHARIGKPYRGKEHNLLHTTTRLETAVELAAAQNVTVTPRREQEHYFDAAPISLIFDIWIDEVSTALQTPLDPLRWRPNLFAFAAHGLRLLEKDLLGASIEVGSAILRVSEPIDRCVTTTYDVRSGQRNDAVLAYVARSRDNVMGIYCEVELAGTVRAGEPLRLRAR